MRATERTQIALFWTDADGTETPPGHWIDIAIGIAAAKRLELVDEARLMALLSTAEADAAIVAWDAKYTFNAWRPITAIGDRGRRPATPRSRPTRRGRRCCRRRRSPNTSPATARSAPPPPTILARFFGGDRMDFNARTDAPRLRGVVRHFASFSAAAEEAGMSRIYGGIHFRFSHLDGAAAGDRLARYVFDNFFRPLAPIAASVNSSAP